MKNQIDESQMPLLLQVAEVKVQYLPKPPLSNQPKVHNSADAEKILRYNWSNDMELIEEFNVLFLNRANNVKGILRLSRGGLTGTVADPRILLELLSKVWPLQLLQVIIIHLEH